MATSSSRDVRLTLSVDTLGEDGIKELQKAVEALGKDGGAAAPEFQKLADEIGRLGEQSQALTTFRELSEETDKLAARQADAAASTAALAAELVTLQATTAQTTARQSEANAKHIEGQKAQIEARNTLRSLAAEYKVNGDETRDYAKRLKDATAEQNRANLAMVDLRVNLKAANAEVDKAETAQGKLENRLKRSTAEVAQLDKALVQQKTSLSEAADAAEALGLSTENVATAEGNLAVAFRQVGASIQQAEQDARDLAAAQRLVTAALGSQQAEADDAAAAWRRQAEAQAEAAQAAMRAAQVIDTAFSTLGVRSIQQVQNELLDARTAMSTLAAESQRTGTSMAGAFAAGENKIKTLEREIRELSGTLTFADKSANLFRNSLGQIAAGNLIADAVGSIVEKVKDMGRQFITANLEIERLTRTLTQVTGSAEGAAQKIAFLRDTAQTAGISISSITDSFIRFQASASASGVAASEIDAIFKSVTVAGSKMGLSAERVALALDALGQIASKGVLSMEELRQQLGDSLPGATAIAAKGLGVTTAQLTKMVESGQILAGDFFPAFRRGLEETFGGSDTKVLGLMQSFARLGNEFTKLYQQAQDSTAFKVLGASIDAITNNFTSLVSVVGGVGKAFLGLKLLEYAKTFYAVGAATTKLAADTALHTASVVANSAATSINTAAKTANIATTKAQAAANSAAATTAGVFTATLTATSGALASLATGARALFAALGGLPGALIAVALNARELGTWIGETVAKWGAAGAAMKKYEQEMAAQAAREKQIAADREQAQARAFQAIQRELLAASKKRESSAATTLAMQKETSAENTRAEAIERVAALYGEQARSAQAAVVASGVRQAALEKESAARAEYVAAIESEIAQTEVLLSQTKVRNEKAEETLKKLKELLAVKKQESAESANAVANMKLEVSERRIVAEALKDNSEKVKDYAQASRDAKVTETELLEMQKQGLPVAEALAAARIKTAEMTRLAADAVKDLIANTKLEYQAKIQNVEATRSALDSEAQLYAQLAANAKARGDLNMANYYETESKKKSIEASKLAIEIKRIELELEKAELAIKIENLDKSDALYATRLKELQLRQQMNDIRTKALTAESELLRLKGNEVTTTNSLTGALGKEANVRDQVTGAIGREIAAREKAVALREQEISLAEREAEVKRKALNVDKDGFSLDNNGNRQMQSVPNDRYVLDTAKSQGLTDEQALALVDRFIRNGRGVGTAKGSDWFSTVNKAISDAVVAATRERVRQQDPLASGSRTPAPSASNPSGGANAVGGVTTEAPGGGKTVTVNLNGRKFGAVSGLNDQQSTDLTAILRGLENAQGTAA